MAFSAVQITLVASTATPLLVQGTTGTKFKVIAGTVSDPLPVVIQNLDASATVWIGGSNVSATTGLRLVAGDSMPLSLVGGDSGSTSEIPYAFSTGTPIVAVLVGRQ